MLLVDCNLVLRARGTTSFVKVASNIFHAALLLRTSLQTTTTGAVAPALEENKWVFISAEKKHCNEKKYCNELLKRSVVKTSSKELFYKRVI